jgi:hypothetical protein
VLKRETRSQKTPPIKVVSSAEYVILVKELSICVAGYYVPHVCSFASADIKIICSADLNAGISGYDI